MPLSEVTFMPLSEVNFLPLSEVTICYDDWRGESQRL